MPSPKFNKPSIGLKFKNINKKKYKRPDIIKLLEIEHLGNNNDISNYTGVYTIYLNITT